MKRIAVMTSGGDAPGMNAATRAVVRAGVLSGYRMFGVRDGYAGLMRGELSELGPRDVGGIIQQGGTILGTSRCREFLTVEGQILAVEQLRRQDISALIVIGGNGSQSGANALAQLGVSVVGVASTIDNDLVGTDLSVGATTAVDIALEAIDRLRVSAASLHRIFLVEVMGRHSGYLAALTAIAGGAEALVVPERKSDPELIAEQLHALRQRGKQHAIVVVAEGAACTTDSLFRYFDEHADQWGFDTRLTRLGHVQRGGSPNVYDRMLATKLGVAAIEQIRRGETNVLMGVSGNAMTSTPLTKVAGQTKKLDTTLLELADSLAQ